MKHLYKGELKFNEVGKKSSFLDGEVLTDQELYFLFEKLEEYRNGKVSEEEKKQYDEMLWEREKFKMKHYDIRFKITDSEKREYESPGMPIYEFTVHFFDEEGNRIDSDDYYLYENLNCLSGYNLHLQYLYGPSKQADNLTAEMIMLDERYRLKILMRNERL